MTLFEVDEGSKPPGPSGPVVRVRLTVAYDGTPFRGFARSPSVPTVGGALEQAVTTFLQHRVELTCAGRTDAGVHAWGQVVHFDTTVKKPDLDRLQRSVNRQLAPDVVVRDAAVAAPGFDARRSAVFRRYRYTVLNRPVPDPFLARTAWHLEEPLHVRSMLLACDPLIGEHDFTSFCRRPPDVDADEPLIRRVFEAGWTEVGDGVLRFEIKASAFCHQMVRSIVGLMVYVGRGKRKAGDVAWIMRARDRHASAPIAPPHGLCLWEVGYPDS